MNKKHIYAGLAAAAVVFCGMPVVIDLVEGVRFNQCMSENGIEDYKVRQNAVTLVTLYPRDGSSHVGFDFSCTKETSCDPVLVEGKTRTPMRRMSEKQLKVLRGVDACRRGGLLAAVYRRLGMVGPKVE